VVVDRETTGARALGEEDSLLEVRIEGELERDDPREQLVGVRQRRSISLGSHGLIIDVGCDIEGAILDK
jgi:hypothetical protein